MILKLIRVWKDRKLFWKRNNMDEEMRLRGTDVILYASVSFVFLQVQKGQWCRWERIFLSEVVVTDVWKA